MLNPILDILLIALCTVIITDRTDFFEYIKRWIWNFAFDYKKEYKGFEFKLLDCSLCQTWWLSLIYLLITKSVTLPLIAFSLFVAYLTPAINTLLIFINELFSWLFEQLFQLID